jgi:hypothetical protein
MTSLHDLPFEVLREILFQAADRKTVYKGHIELSRVCRFFRAVSRKIYKILSVAVCCCGDPRVIGHAANFIRRYECQGLVAIVRRGPIRGDILFADPMPSVTVVSEHTSKEATDQSLATWFPSSLPNLVEYEIESSAKSLSVPVINQTFSKLTLDGSTHNIDHVMVTCIPDRVTHLTINSGVALSGDCKFTGADLRELEVGYGTDPNTLYRIIGNCSTRLEYLNVVSYSSHAHQSPPVADTFSNIRHLTIGGGLFDYTIQALFSPSKTFRHMETLCLYQPHGPTTEYDMLEIDDTRFPNLARLEIGGGSKPIRKSVQRLVIRSPVIAKISISPFPFCQAVEIDTPNLHYFRFAREGGHDDTPIHVRNARFTRIRELYGSYSTFAEFQPHLPAAMSILDIYCVSDSMDYTFRLESVSISCVRIQFAVNVHSASAKSVHVVCDAKSVTIQPPAGSKYGSFKCRVQNFATPSDLTMC